MNRRGFLRSCCGSVAGAAVALWHRRREPRILCVVSTPCHAVEIQPYPEYYLTKKNLVGLLSCWQDDNLRKGYNIGSDRKVLVIDLGQVPIRLPNSGQLFWSYQTKYVLDDPDGIPIGQLVDQLQQKLGRIKSAILVVRRINEPPQYYG